jgi:Cu/Ag efflux protein CusF
LGVEKYTTQIRASYDSRNVLLERLITRYHSLIMPTMPPRASLTISLLVLLSATLAFSCGPQTEREKAATPTPTPLPVSMIGPTGFPPAVLGKPYPGTGIITTVNQKEGWVAIEHEEIKDLMPAMAMEFWIKDPSIMKGIRVGDKVDFVVVEDSKGQYVTEMTRVAKNR